MSVQSAIKRKTAPDIRARKNGEPIVMLTSYHAHTASLVDRYCDVILVGDSLGNVMHGFETTVPVTLAHPANVAVVRAGGDEVRERELVLDLGDADESSRDDAAAQARASACPPAPGRSGHDISAPRLDPTTDRSTGCIVSRSIVDRLARTRSDPCPPGG